MLALGGRIDEMDFMSFISGTQLTFPAGSAKLEAEA